MLSKKWVHKKRLMRTLPLAFFMAAGLVGCDLPASDPAPSANLKNAVAAGGLALATIHRCLLQIEQAGNTAVPECNAAKQVDAYEAAKARVPVAATIPALQTLDRHIESARAEVVAGLIRLVVPIAKGAKGGAGAAPLARNAQYPLVDHSSWRAN